MKKYQHDFKILNNIAVNEEHFILELQCLEKMGSLIPGQFVQVKIDESPNTFLRRPLSIHDAEISGGRMKLLIQKKGDGTKKLSTLEKDSLINLIYPLGNGFDLPENKKLLLVGGGCGVAPLLFLARELKSRNCHITTLIGARSEAHLTIPNHYSEFGDVLITTEDGSKGTKGFVIHHEIFRHGMDSIDGIYCCGPDPMMKAVARLAKSLNKKCQVSLEQTMACGIGACLCCIVDTHRGNVCTCTEGPVFDYQELKGWGEKE